MEQQSALRNSHVVFRNALTLACALLAICAPAWAQSRQDCAVKAAADRKAITVGEKFKFSLNVEHDSSSVLRLAQEEAGFGPFEIKEAFPAQTVKLSPFLLRTTLSWMLTAYETGDFNISPPALICETKDGLRSEIAADALKMRVNSVNPKGSFEDIRPLKGPAVLQRAFPSWLWAAISLLLLGIIGIGIWIMRRSSRKAKEPSAPKRPPEEIARQALNLLLQEDLASRGLIKEHFDRLSDIVRSYLTARFGVDALESTTSELFRQLKTKAIKTEALDILRKLLIPCDLAKFATYHPAPPEADECMKRAFKIVEITTPQPVLEPPNGARAGSDRK